MNREELVIQVNHAAEKARKLETQFDATDVDNSDAIIEEHGHKLRYCAQQTVWYVYDGSRWVEDFDDVQIEELAKRTLLARAVKFEEESLTESNVAKKSSLTKMARRLRSGAAIEATVRLARTLPEIQVKPEDFDADPMRLNVVNGSLNIVTCKLEPHNASHLATKLVPIEYDAEAECPTWDKFLARSLPDSEIQDFLQVMSGYSLTGDIREQKVFILIGEGANGKSVFLKVLRAMIGDYAVIASADLLVDTRYVSHPAGAARLKGARLATCNEIEGNAKLSEVKIKQLTGGDTLQARRMRENFFEFEPTHKVVLVANYKPEINDTDEGIWRRIAHIPFGVVIPPEERDPHLYDKLHKELSGILTWAVRGCQRWQSEGLQVPDVIDLATADYRAENDPLQSFVEERCTLTGSILKGTFLKAFQQYCLEASIECPSQKRVSSAMQKKGFKERNSGGRYWQGISVDPKYLLEQSGTLERHG